MRTFQFSDAKSHKFWNIAVHGDGFTVTYGKVGSAGQTAAKTFATPEKARAEADKLVREKTAKGYVETTPAAAGSASTADALEAAVRAEPGNLAAWSAFADYLTEQGDPRGEFMRVQLALEDESLPKKERDALKKREKALLKQHLADWLGDLGAWADNDAVRPTFARGWLTRVEFGNLTVAQARGLRSPACRLVRELAITGTAAEVPVGVEGRYADGHYEPGPDVPDGVDAYDDPSLHALCRNPHLGAVRVLQLGEGQTDPAGDEDEYFNCHMSGELAHHLAKQMPHLEELYLFAHRVDAGKLFALPLPGLRVLQLYHSNSYPLDKLAANPSLGNLTHLLCHPHAFDNDEDQEDGGAYIRLPHLRAICRSKHLTGLTHLRLRLTNFGDAGAKEVVKSGVLKQLKVLDLRGGCITDDGAKALAGCPDLRNLASLNLARNALTAAGVAALRATGVRLDAAGQHDETGRDGSDALPEYLYEGDIE